MHETHKHRSVQMVVSVNQDTLGGVLLDLKSVLQIILDFIWLSLLSMLGVIEENFPFNVVPILAQHLCEVFELVADQLQILLVDGVKKHGFFIGAIFEDVH